MAQVLKVSGLRMKIMYKEIEVYKYDELEDLWKNHPDRLCPVRVEWCTRRDDLWEKKIQALAIQKALEICPSITDVTYLFLGEKYDYDDFKKHTWYILSEKHRSNAALHSELSSFVNSILSEERDKFYQEYMNGYFFPNGTMVHKEWLKDEDSSND